MNENKKYFGDSQYLLARYCMPTLLKIKPSSLVNINKKTPEWNKLIIDIQIQIEYFGCQAIVLYENKDIVNLLVYNEKNLKMLISSEEIRQYMVYKGYHFFENSSTEIFGVLKMKLEQFDNAGYEKKTDLFPHEIGILLGYPLVDVEDFIRYHGKNYIYCGCWKVYHNVEEALKIFDLYRKVQQDAICMLRKGKCLADIDKCW